VNVATVDSKKRYSLRSLFRSLFLGRGWLDTLVLAGGWIAVALAIWHAARTGKGWGGAIGVTAMVVLYTLVPWLRERGEAARRKKQFGTVTIDDWGVTRVSGDLREAVAWADLAWVAIKTTDDGPFAEDFFFLLGGADGKGVVIPHFLATELNLLATLQARLPGLDNEQVVLAVGSTADAMFTIWSRSPQPTGPLN
jgi:hypothetical protein